jgi:hypothetical protein
MSGESELETVQRRIAYIDHLRGLHRFERIVGLVVILMGVAIIVAESYLRTLPHILLIGAWAMLAAGWIIFIYVIFKRTAWRKANPFETWRP